MTITSKNARNACAELTQAHQLMVDAADRLGSGPGDGGLWDAILIVLDAREIAGLLVDPDPVVISSDSPVFWA